MLEQIRRVTFAMPIEPDIEKRNRALIAFIMLTGARVDAAASIRLKHVNLNEGKVFQDAKQIRTKYSKSSRTTFAQRASRAPRQSDSTAGRCLPRALKPPI
jgi:integrase